VSSSETEGIEELEFGLDIGGKINNIGGGDREKSIRGGNKRFKERGNSTSLQGK